MYYKMLLINTYTQEILRELEFDEEESIVEIIKGAETAREQKLDIFMIDGQKRTLACEFVYYSIHEGKKLTTYKLFFKTRLAPVQAKILE